ncbi:MAG: CDP-alcohol phosphatidyltransferase family protein [Candidatus Cloacimonetes bacterium]|nr:CDP-alcohol phosphatidyltransferase family protein [Candidatus Cloacimonadota bacterium]
MNSKSIPKIRELRNICQPPIKFNDTLILAYIVRYFSIYLTKLFLYTKTTANQISVISMLFGIMGSILFLNMHPWYIFVGSIFLIVYVLLDFVDGEVARYRNNSTLTGKYLDDVNHSITVPILLLCISFGIFGVFENIWILFLGCLAAVCEPMGHAVYWGYPYRILYSEIFSLIDKYKSDESRKIPDYVLQVEEGSFKGKMATFLIRFHSRNKRVLRTSIIQELYKKIWFINQITNISIIVGLTAPFLSSLQNPSVCANILSLIIIIYGINRPIVLLQLYLGRIILKNETLEYEVNQAFNKLKEFKLKEDMNDKKS